MKFTLLLIIIVIISSCTFSKKREGDILMDSKGNYYILTNDGVLGSERYRLIEVDTTKFKPVGFKSCNH